MMNGSVRERYNKCGTPGCRCTRGDLHGPYFSRRWSENGRRREEYVRRDQIDDVRAQCEARRQHEHQVVAARKECRELTRMLKELE
jgi:hypothetical protein